MSRLLDILLDSGMPAGMARDKLEGINIEEEYQRVQNKTSELPRMTRDMVEARWKINQEFKAHGIEDVPCYVIEEYTKFDKSWATVFTSYDPKLLRWAWRKSNERLIEQGKSLNMVRTNMLDHELLIIDPPNLVMEGGEYEGFTIERVKPEKADDPYLLIKLGEAICHAECNPVTDDQVRGMIDSVMDKLGSVEPQETTPNKD